MAENLHFRKELIGHGPFQLLASGFFFVIRRRNYDPIGRTNGRELEIREGLISAETHLAIPVVSSTYFSLLNYYH